MCCSDRSKCWFSDDQDTCKLWFEVQTDIIGMKALAKSNQKGER